MYMVKISFGGNFASRCVQCVLTLSTLCPCCIHAFHCVIFSIYKTRCKTVARIARSLQRIATGRTVRESNPGGGEVFRTRPDRSWGPPSLLYNGYRVIPGGKAAGARFPTYGLLKIKENSQCPP